MPTIESKHYVGVADYERLGHGRNVTVEFTSQEAQTIKNASGVEVITGLIANLRISELFKETPFDRSALTNMIWEAKDMIGARDAGAGASITIMIRLVPSYSILDVRVSRN